MTDIGSGPEDLPYFEYRVLYRLVELLPQHVPLEHAVDLQTLAADFAEHLDAMGSVAHLFQEPPPIEEERGIKLDPVIRTLHRQGLAEFDTYGHIQPTFEGRQLVAAWRREWKKTGSPTSKPRVFIGSSKEGLQIARYLQLDLEHNTECDLWSQGPFGLGEGTLESLVKATSEYDYAVLVLTPDDVTTKRGVSGNSPRDNVLFELGLFMGALGRDHVFMVCCRDESIELPSDLAGVTIATFAKRDNLQGALGPVSTRLMQAMGVI